MSDDHHHVPAESKPMNGDKVRPSEDARRAELAMSAPLNGAAVALTFSTRTIGELDLAEQANIAHGPQQVNNGVSAPAATTHADACNRQLGQNELLEHQDGHRLDIGTAGAAGASGAAMATVGALDRPAHR